MRELLKNKLTIFGACIILILVAVAFLAPIIARYDPASINIKDALIAPCQEYIFGTDALGRDIFSRMVYATRVALSIGLVAVGIAALIGIVLGSAAGYYGGWVDNLIMRFTDIMLCFPAFFLILSVIAIIGPNIFNIMIIIGLTSWMGIARLIRAEIMSLKTRDFVSASKALGASDYYIILKHLILVSYFSPIITTFLVVSD